MKTLIGFVTFGNMEFSKLTVKSIKETTKNKVDFFIVVGKPGDEKTKSWLLDENIPCIVHNTNYGFPASINDIYDYAWKMNNYDNLIIVGNDIVPYPYCIDSLINFANETGYEMISALQFDVKTLIKLFPETKQYFEGENYIFKNFNSKPWEVFKEFSSEYEVADMQLFDIQNCGLYKKSVFDKIGYTDVNFYPAYYIDNDYARRIINANIKCCALTNARFFHFWSRTIHQETGGSTGDYFDNNRRFYKLKWGEDFGKELWKIPFNGKDKPVNNSFILPGNLKISNRDDEIKIIDFWKTLVKR